MPKYSRLEQHFELFTYLFEIFEYFPEIISSVLHGRWLHVGFQSNKQMQNSVFSSKIVVLKTLVFYLCICNMPGYYDIYGECRDIDECQYQKCGAHGTCENTEKIKNESKNVVGFL